MVNRFFILDGHIPVNAARIHYQWPVVFLSYTIIVLAAFLALAVLRQIDPGDSRSRSRGTLLGAAVLGTGIWSMHFTGMIALKMGMTHSYDLWLTALSLAVAFLFSFAVFRNATRARFTARTISLNAPLLGIGVASMHFVGMEAMQIDGSLSYRPALFALSVLIAIAASGAAMAIMRFVANDTRGRAALQLAVALVMGLAVCGMHYVGMAAAVIVPFADCELNPPQSETVLAIFVGIGTLIIFGLSIILLIQGFIKPDDKHKSSAKWHYIYFILAVFDLLTAGVSVYISDLLHETYDDATAIRRTWIGYRDEIVKTGFAAHAINRSGNDVLKNHDVEGERKKFYSALEDYSTRVLRVKASVMASSASLERNGQFNPLIRRLNDSFDVIMQITPKIKVAAESVFQMESTGDVQGAFLSMEDMDEIFSEQSRYILLLDDTIGQINVNLLDSLGLVTNRIRYYEYIVMLLMVIMVFTATYYGFRLAKKAKDEEKLEERRRHVTEKYEAILKNIPGIVFTSKLDDKRTIIYIAEEGQSISGYKNKDFDNGVTLSHFTHPEDFGPASRSIKTQLAAGPRYKIEYRVLTVDGHTKWVQERGAPSIGNPDEVHAIVLDVTDSKLAEFELQRYREGLEQLVIEQTKDLTEQKEKAEESARSKSEFLSNMSHELRTPMHAILSYSDMGLTDIAESQTEAIKEYLGNIKLAGLRLLGLLNDLLDLAKLQSGKMIYKRADANFIDVVRHALLEVKPLLEKKRIEVSQDVQAHSTLARIDRNRIIQVLVNLLSNAIRFSEPAKKISIEISNCAAKDGAGVLRCCLADEGPGIPEGELQSIFDKFVQSSKTKTGAGGTGLGLAICREIVEAHGGTIWAENIEPHGAAFIFDIPLVTAAKEHALQA